MAYGKIHWRQHEPVCCAMQQAAGLGAYSYGRCSPCAFPSCISAQHRHSPLVLYNLLRTPTSVTITSWCFFTNKQVRIREDFCELHLTVCNGQVASYRHLCIGKKVKAERRLPPFLPDSHPVQSRASWSFATFDALFRLPSPFLKMFAKVSLVATGQAVANLWSRT